MVYLWPVKVKQISCVNFNKKCSFISHTKHRMQTIPWLTFLDDTTETSGSLGVALDESRVLRVGVTKISLHFVVSYIICQLQGKETSVTPCPIPMRTPIAQYVLCSQLVTRSEIAGFAIS